MGAKTNRVIELAEQIKELHVLGTKCLSDGGFLMLKVERRDKQLSVNPKDYDFGLPKIGDKIEKTTRINHRSAMKGLETSFLVINEAIGYGMPRLLIGEKYHPKIIDCIIEQLEAEQQDLAAEIKIMGADL